MFVVVRVSTDACACECVPQQQLVSSHRSRTGGCRREAASGINTHSPHKAQLGRVLQHHKQTNALYQDTSWQLFSFLLLFCPLFLSSPPPARCLQQAASLCFSLFCLVPLSLSAVVPSSLIEKQASPPPPTPIPLSTLLFFPISPSPYPPLSNSRSLSPW